MAEINAIETHYKGYRFRSKLEARWTIFLDVMGIKWQYEYEGFVLHGDVPYLPDFYFPQFEIWGEVKPYTLRPLEREKCKRLCECTQQEVLLLDDMPDFRPYTLFYWVPLGQQKDLTDTPLISSGEVDTCEIVITDDLRSCDPYLWGFDRRAKESLYGKTYSDAVNSARSARF